MIDRETMPLSSISFVAESTLGRLSKWLRLAGFYTAYVRGKPDARHLVIQCKDDRSIILTRTRRIQHKLPPERILFIHANAPLDQARYVMRHLNLGYHDLSPLSICAECNKVLKSLDKTDIQHRLPDYTFRQHEQFYGCDACERIYWPGSHAQRWMTRMHQWFED
jgi:uncharacterized protein with PIN domain